MPIAMVRMLSVETSAPFPVWHISPTLPIWFSVLCMAVLCGGRSIFPLILLPHFPLSPFPFPLSPFPFPFPKVYFSWATFAAQPISTLPCCGAQSSFYSCVAMLLIVTDAVCCQQQVCNCFPDGAGSCVLFFVAPFFLAGGGWKAPDSGGGGWLCQGGGVPVKNLVWTTARGGDLGIVSPNFL